MLSSNVLAALPLLYPESLTSRVVAPLLFTPPPHRVPVIVRQSQQMTENSAQSTAIPVVEHLSKPVLSGGGRFTSGDALPIPNAEINMGDAMPSLITDPTSHGTAVSPAPVQAAPRAVRVSQLSPGMLLTPIRRVYPAIARAAGVSGQVIVSAVISSTGSI